MVKKVLSHLFNLGEKLEARKFELWTKLNDFDSEIASIYKYEDMYISTLENMLATYEEE